jgi:hypothetical protein
MQALPEQQKPSAVSALQQRTSNESVRLVRKLRWIGMEEEAKSLLKELAQRRANDRVSVIAPSRETD